MGKTKYSNEELKKKEYDEQMKEAANDKLFMERTLKTQKEFEAIVKGLAERYPSINLSEEELLAEATKWEVSHGGMSGRVAQQFIDYLVAIHSMQADGKGTI